VNGARIKSNKNNVNKNTAYKSELRAIAKDFCPSVDTPVSPEKTDKPIETLFEGGRLGPAPGTM